ncbi:MAG: hypothetical protein JXQ76_06130 [Campylobacterales bacterium]|nr:hypothetical protein [Campylobacterales bacterium]
MRKLFPLLILSTLLHSQEFYYKNGQKVYLTKQETTLRSHSSIDTFVDEHNKTLGVSDEIIIEMQKDSIKSIAAKYQLNVVEKIGNRFYRCKVQNRQEVFEIAAKIYHEEGVKGSHPNFIKRKYAR